MSHKRYAVIGAGMQGTAAAYDLARFGHAETVALADRSLDRAQASAERVNRLVGSSVCRPLAMDAADVGAVSGELKGFDVALSCVPYHLHAGVERAAIEAGCSAVDMGNDTDVTLETLQLDAEARSKGVTVVTDAGLAPGLVNSMALSFMEQADSIDSVRLYCGGLPQNPKPPFNYSLRFSIEGLVGEYIDEAIALRDGEVVRLETMAELEQIEVEGLGTLEAFTTSSGTSTAPWTFQGVVRNYEYKTLRYPGHCELMRAFREAGLWGEDPIDVGGAVLRPIDLFCTLMGPRLLDPEDRDLVVACGIAAGSKDGAHVELRADIVDYHDEATGFSAMERLTGFSTSIIAIEIAHGNVARGCVPYEKAMGGLAFLDQLERRGIVVRRSIRFS